MRKKKSWFLFGLLTLIVAACGPALPADSVASRAPRVADPVPDTVAVWTQAVPATADVLPDGAVVAAAGDDKAFGQAKPAVARADGGQASVPERASATALPTRTPSPTALPTRTPLPAPTSTPTPTTSLTVAATASPPAGTETATVNTPAPGAVPTAVPTVPAAAGKDIVHFLLIGLDHSGGLKTELTDVMIVAVVNKETAQVSLLSIPRDLWVYIPTYGYSRINMAHKLGYLNDYPGGGPALLSKTIEMNLGIPIDHWARIDFEGFATAVDELGGVDLIVACPVDLQYRSTDAGQSRILDPGEYHLDGETALRYVRTRRDGTDFDRARRQHQFLKAVWDQTREPGLIRKIPGLWSALKDTFETDLNLGDVLSLAPLALEVKPQSVRSRYIAYGHTVDWTTDQGWRVLLPKPDAIRAVVESLYAPSPVQAEAGKAGVHLAVENGTWNDQMGLVAADRLRWEGFEVDDVATSAERGQSTTQIVVYRDHPEAVKQLMKLLNVRRKDVLYEPDTAAEVDILVTLGADYNSCR